jgi:hypothetical protein
MVQKPSTTGKAPKWLQATFVKSVDLSKYPGPPAGAPPLSHMPGP